ncbi:hypothetical protein AVEN_207971-1 [Araneus ventricosus]|uniref:Uncharacterized protein n=1 Tax=Araneus ventricosus TaxID=182803 RepID=A0A4Y2V6R6_ARAVE|nr:hypothetical protein AVEN_207971-1 [Araneus ventricosus]
MQHTTCLDIDGLNVVIRSYGFPDHLMYLQLIFFFSDALNASVYETAVDSDMYLVARIPIAAAAISKKPDILEKVRRCMRRNAISTCMPMEEIINNSYDSCNYSKLFTLLSVYLSLEGGISEHDFLYDYDS